MAYTNEFGTFKVNGVPILGKLQTGGDVFFVDPTNGNDGNTGDRPDRAKVGLETTAGAYSLATTNKGDVIYYLAGATSLTLASALTWSKSYTHLIGADNAAPNIIASRNRIFHSFNASPAITISGSGCAFKNFYFSHGRGSATNLIGVKVTGSRNHFYRVHFAGPQHATEGDEATYRLVQLSASSENLFEECWFGNDSTMRSAANTSLHLTSSCERNTLRNCNFMSIADAATPTHILVDATGIDRWLLIEGNVTMVNMGTSLTQAIDSNISDTTNNKILITGNLNVVGADDVADATGDGTIYMNRHTETQNVMGLTLNPAVS